ncbi:hypothetical protein HDU78_008522 [Chytriomyces hyalinus]|nr:hypothetical protein HDU78_008522 [Chytriomyces hyalinus]
MVMLHLGSGHPEFRDCIIEAGIRVQGESANCTEHAFDDGSTDRSYVASKPGMQYMINVHVDNPAWRHMPIRSISSGQAIIRADVWIDGGYADGLMLVQNGSADIKDKQCGDRRFNFVFDTPKIVSDGGISDKNTTDKIGTIEVTFQVAIVAYMAPQPVAVGAPSECPPLPLFSLAAPRHIPRWHTPPLASDKRISHTFHYKTEDFLEIEGVLPGSNPADPAPESNATPVETNAEHAKIEAKKEENEEEDAIEFVSSTPIVKRPVELVDLTTTTSEPKRRGRTSSSSTVIDVDAPVVVKREKSFTGKRESKVEIIDLT